jgi:hypothetical protein
MKTQYAEKRREGSQHGMQQAAKPHTNNHGTTQVQSVMITAITLFALSGLMVGFAVGAFTHPRQTTQANKNNSMSAPVIDRKPTPTKTTTVDIATVRIGCPILGANSYSAMQIPDGTTDYTVSTQIVDKSIDNTTPCGKGKNLAVPDLTCKIWLVKKETDVSRLNENISKLPDDEKQAVWNFQAPFPKEEQGALQVDNGSTTAIPCNQTGGLTVWHYKLSPTIDEGHYFLAVIANWHGTFSNWTWVPITVAKNQ